MAIERISEPVCYGCKHYWCGKWCKAFPNGIPHAILTGKNRHTQPVDGDSGIQFEPLDKKVR